jgi:hypothetical protein
VGLAQLMSQVMTLVTLVLEPGAPPAIRDVSAAFLSSRRHIDQMRRTFRIARAHVDDSDQLPFGHSNRTAIAVPCI